MLAPGCTHHDVSWPVFKVTHCVAGSAFACPQCRRMVGMGERRVLIEWKSCTGKDWKGGSGMTNYCDTCARELANAIREEAAGAV